MDWTPIWPAISAGVPALCGFGLALLRFLDRRAQRQAIIDAKTPEQLQALQKIPEPSLLLDKGGPALLLLALGGGMAAWQGNVRALAHRDLKPVNITSAEQRWREELAAMEPAEPAPIAECTSVNCPSPGRCVGGVCQGQADKPLLPAPAKKSKPKRPPPARAEAAPLDVTADHPSDWDASPVAGAFADRGPAAWGWR